MYNDMENQVHHLEQEAYRAVLLAFKAQADAITWEKESLITELRKELRVSDDDHRKLLARVNADDVIKRIREWRLGLDNQAALSSARRKQKIISSVPPMSLGSQSSPIPFPSMNTPGRRRKRSKLDFSSGSGGARHVVNPSLSAHIHTDSTELNPLIGRRVMTRWPGDNNFYEAMIIEYDPSQARHCLQYDKDAPQETTQWVALDELPRDVIRWVDEDPSDLVAGGMDLQGHVGGRDIVNGQSTQQIPLNENGSGDKIPEYIEIFDTEVVFSEVDKILNSSTRGPEDIQTARKMICDQERALMDAFAILGHAIDADTDEEHAPPPEPGQQ